MKMRFIELKMWRSKSKSKKPRFLTNFLVRNLGFLRTSYMFIKYFCISVFSVSVLVFLVFLH